MTQIFTTIAGLRCFRRDYHDPSSVGFVPTMGGLHRGHRSLMDRAKQENRGVIVSIFVNPLQFGTGEDFAHYPRDLDRDRDLCAAADVDAIFAPSAEEILGIIPTPHTQVIPPEPMTSVLCGQSRLGHFTGVATIVTKLLQIVQPHKVYFGQKDGQQLAILRQVIGDLNLPVQVIGCPTVREPSGLACSSRNQYLNSSELELAAMLYRSLEAAANAFKAGINDRDTLFAVVRAMLAKQPQIELEYVDLVQPYSLQPVEVVGASVSKTAPTSPVAMLAIAARIGKTRLIDNMLLQSRKPIIAIDGPAGAGKSTVAKLVAQQLGLLYLDTGAMYRAVTWAVLQAGLELDQTAAIAEVASQSRIEMQASSSPAQPPQVFVNGVEVTQAIRSPAVTSHVSEIAAQPTVREILVQQQQEIGKLGGVVMEGRDIGTQVFPDAEVKIFLTASIQERAQRRQQDLLAQSQPSMDLAELEATIQERDQQDSTRAISPLRQAVDAIAVNTDGLTIDEVVNRIVDLYHSRQLAVQQP